MNDRGCIYDFDEIFPGPQALSEKELLKNLRDTLCSSKEVSTTYKNTTRLFHSYTDGKNTSRVLNEILNQS
jgi:CDP-glycerol glycerophosphotransferase (TagB/SpsB family)